MAAPIDLDLPPPPGCNPYRETGFKLVRATQNGHVRRETSRDRALGGRNIASCTERRLYADQVEVCPERSWPERSSPALPPPRLARVRGALAAGVDFSGRASERASGGGGKFGHSSPFRGRRKPVRQLSRRACRGLRARYRGRGDFLSRGAAVRSAQSESD